MKTLSARRAQPSAAAGAGCLAAVDQQPLAAAAHQHAGRPRRALGTEPAVPTKKIESSIALA